MLLMMTMMTDSICHDNDALDYDDDDDDNDFRFVAAIIQQQSLPSSFVADSCMAAEGVI